MNFKNATQAISLAALKLITATGVAAPANVACEAALTAPIELPYAVPSYDAPELATELTAQIRARGANPAAFNVVERLAEPLIQNVAKFLQTRGNYPTIFDHNEASDLATQVSDELFARLRLHKEERRRARWFGWWPSAPTDTVRQIRYLHHALIKLTEDAKGSTETVRRVIEITESLITPAERLRAVLVEVAEALEAHPEFQRRVITLADDVGLQLQILLNLNASLHQRIQFDAYTQERIRRLLGVVLPLHATQGSPDEDFSPLAPPDPGRPVEAPTRGARPPMPFKDVLALANQTTNWDDHEEILKKYFAAAKNGLTTAEVLKMAKSAGHKRRKYDTRDELCFGFVKAKADTLTLDEVLKLAEGTGTYNVQDDLLIFFARDQQRRLSNADLARLGQALHLDTNRTKFVKLWHP